MTALHHPQVQALAALYKPPARHENAPPVAAGEASGKSADQARFQCDDSTALRKLRGLLPTLAVEGRIILSAGRDIFHTGGIDVEDGKRLALAVKRTERIIETLADAELEAIR